MDDGEGFGRMIFFMVMMFIAFIQWVAKRMKDRREARRWQEEVGREPQRHSRSTPTQTPTPTPPPAQRPQRKRATPPPLPTPARQPRAPESAQTAPTATVPSVPDGMEDLRDLFQRRANRAQETEQEPPAVPLPVPAVAVPKVRRTATPAALVSHPAGVHRRGGNFDHTALDKMLKDPNSARLAIVLKEVLGEPVGIRGQR